MSEQDKPFVINDRRKFRMDGEPVAPIEHPPEPPAAVETPEPEAAKPSAPIPFPVREEAHTNSAHTVTPVPEPAQPEASADESGEPPLPAPPTPEEIEEVRRAYEATAERLDTMIRSQNLGAEHAPPMDFTQLVQSIYMSAMIQLGAGTQQGQQARVDIIGAKQSIDMLGVVAEKSAGNLSESEQRLIDAALFELRMGFLEITQILARQAAARQTPPTGGGTPGTPTGGGGSFGGGGFSGGGFSGGGPRIVR